MVDFLFWIGWYNALGVLLLVGFQHEGFADFMLRRATEVIAQEYTHGPFGRMWLWWATAGNAFLGAVMLLALRWPPSAQYDVAMGVVALYLVMWLVLLFGARSPRYGRGVYVCHALWIGQMGWGVWALSTMSVG